MQLGQTYEIDGYARIAPLSFEYKDIFPQYGLDVFGENTEGQDYQHPDGNVAGKVFWGGGGRYYLNIYWQKSGTNADFEMCIRDRRRLNTLYEYQRNAYEAVLGNQRRFRHNILNMLYGFEGTILSDDTGEIRRYYEQLIEKCALVNNDNVLALRRVTQPALKGLLLRCLLYTSRCV